MQAYVFLDNISTNRILLHHYIKLETLFIIKVINHSTKIYLCTRYDLFSRYTLVITMYCWQVSRTILKHWNIMIPEMPRITACPLHNTICFFSCHKRNIINNLLTYRINGISIIGIALESKLPDIITDIKCIQFFGQYVCYIILFYTKGQTAIHFHLAAFRDHIRRGSSLDGSDIDRNMINDRLKLRTICFDFP